MRPRYLALWLLVMPVAARAQQDPGTAPSAPSTGPGVTMRSPLGFFFHVEAGGGYLRTSGSTGRTAFTTAGGALGISLGGGWAPSEEWMVGLECSSWKALSPSGLGESTSVELDAVGVSVTRYLVPANVFASVTVSGTRVAITDPYGQEFGGSQIGFGFKVAIGKEWWVNPWLGMGLGGEFFFAVNRDQAGSSGTLRTLGAGLVYSLTVH
ncbi:MAG TPA: hypothetical protein VLT82_08685 [Myxococcaceae bacterium]|nr:hypothetical protein [Myxococcaceae bacterium]